MSRCFPYPPPGYMKNGSGKALIESIELARESEKAKKDFLRKQRKREKRERKENGKEKPIQFFSGEDKKCNDSKGGHLLKKTEDETRLEKSDVTEEHELPAACYLSDGTQNNNKRKCHTLISNGNHNHGNIIRIRLPKRGDTTYVVKETATPNGQVFCSTSSGTAERDERGIARTARVVKRTTTANGRVSCSTSSGMPERDEKDNARTARVAKETTTASERVSCSTPSGIAERDSTRIASLSKTFESGLQSECKVKTEELLYKTLIENWVPIPIQNVLTDFDDQQWLFETKKQDGQVAKRLKASNDISCSWNHTSGPRACYLPDADICALPYTIPF